MKKEGICIDKFISDQLSVWPLASSNFRSMKQARTREIEVNGLKVTVQNNPERITSSTAEIDEASLNARPCFLCPENEPAEQMRLRLDGRKGRHYNIQLNPYPIFPQHLVIARRTHKPQSIWRHYVDMLDMTRTLPAFTVFYNGPVSGASAPDHFHFQACPQGSMPVEREIDSLLSLASSARDEDGQPQNAVLHREGQTPGTTAGLTYVTSVSEAELYHYRGYARGIFALRARTVKSLAKLFYLLLDTFPILPGETEPRFNLFAYYKQGEYRSFVIFRGELRPHHYFSSGEDHLTISPGAADMCGYFVAPVADDFDKLDSRMLSEILDEVTVSAEVESKALWKLTRRQPKLNVGIMSAETIVFEILSDGAGPQKVSWREGKIDYNGTLYDELFFDAVTSSTLFAEASFALNDVVIGVDFHWQRKQRQTFAGSLRFIVEGDKITAINTIGVEDYLLSVISSEMKASASLEFLKAHAIISRSWVMSQVSRAVAEDREADRCCASSDSHVASCHSSQNREQDVAESSRSEFHGTDGDGTAVFIKWWDHDDHQNFDVCADDHCQRYQGLTMAVGENVRKAIDQTWGEVLTYNGEICDARFYKCCGGRMETFDTCWEDVDYPYLKSVPDTPEDGGDPFCHTDDEEVLSQVLNDYDMETKDFYEWEVRYGRGYLSDLIRRRSGIDFGDIEALIPLERGGSGRIFKMKIVGSKKSMVIGKELVIRRWLSESHLKSSAFELSFEEGGDASGQVSASAPEPRSGEGVFVLRGRGWGHGVGLCQIGAAVMSVRGYSYQQILLHYYPGSVLERR